LAAVPLLVACRSSARTDDPPPAAEPATCVNGEPASVCAERCDAGDLEACEMLGSDYFAGRGVPQDVGRSADLVQRACDGGRPSACMGLAMAYFEGHGRPTDISRATALRERACDLGSTKACTALGRPRPRSPGRAR
jgi:TPR repeat protein